MRKPLIYGNWKMNLNMQESADLIASMLSIKIDYTKVDIGVAPDFCSLAKVADTIRSMGYDISVGAQNISVEEKGAFTGEVSADMVLSTGADTVIVGHSERRAIYKETNKEINAKVRAALRNNLKVILCVGESLEEREASVAKDTVLYQVGMGLHGVNMDRMNKVTIAYEPVWAIGTGKTATPADAEEIHASIRAHLSKMFGPVVANKVRILYGGSVKPDNVSALMMRENIDGALVGGASLDATTFGKLINFNS
ncbi:MAG: triose-phosphate isomerase [Denitrovibrio sp.]|nr:MAG: triose-phosphate isomerase [Denitrovibrio sp.]